MVVRASFKAERVDVGTECFGDAQSVRGEERHQRVVSC